MRFAIYDGLTASNVPSVIKQIDFIILPCVVTEFTGELAVPPIVEFLVD